MKNFSYRLTPGQLVIDRATGRRGCVQTVSVITSDLPVGGMEPYQRAEVMFEPSASCWKLEGSSQNLIEHYLDPA